MPQPPAYHAISFGPGPSTVVPPTPMAYGEAAGKFVPGRPAGTPFTPTTAGQNEPVSPLEVNSVWPCAAACWSTASSAVSKPLTCASTSHSPAEKLACLLVLSVTQRLIVARMSSLESDGPT